MIGRRPKRSDSEPSIGENRNCISAQAVPNTPYTIAARAVLPPMKSSTSFGSTGMMMPIANMSSRTVTKTNAKAARRGPGAVGSVMGAQLATFQVNATWWLSTIRRAASSVGVKPDIERHSRIRCD